MGKKINKIMLVYILMYLLFFTGYRHQLEKENILIYSLWFITFLFIMIAMLLWERKKRVLFPPNVGTYGIFILSYITAVIHSVNFIESMNELIIMSVALFIFIITLNVVKLGWEREIIDGLLIVGLIYIGNKLYKILTRLYYFEYDQCTRNILVGDPNKTAGLVGILIVFSLAIYLNRKIPKDKIIPGVLLVGSAVILFITGSRGGYVAVAFGILVVILLNYIYGNIHNIITVKMLTAVVVVVLFPILSTMIMRPALCTGVWTTTITDRYDLFDSALEIITEFTLLGAGPGTWKIIAGPLFDNQFSHPHSAYLLIWAERGIVGILALAILALTVIKTLLIDTKHIGLKAGGLSAIVVSAIHGLADVPLLEPYTLRYLIIIIALGIANATIKGEHNNAELNK